MMKKSKKMLQMLLCLLLLFAFMIVSQPLEAEASSGAWVLVKTEYNDSNNAANWTTTQPRKLGTDHTPLHGSTYAHLSQGQLEFISEREPNPATSSSKVLSNMHAIYTWNAPPSTIPSGGTVNITVKRDVKSNTEGVYVYGLANKIGHGVVGANLKDAVFTANGQEYTTSVFGTSTSAGSRAYPSLGSLAANHTFQLAAGQAGARDQQIRIIFNGGSFLYYENYTYEWRENVSSQPSPAPSTGKSFSDLPSNHWAYDTVIEMVEMGILSGYPDGTFRPNNTISRAEFAKIMVIALDLPTTRPATPSFADVGSTHWAYDVVESARNYLTGYRDTRTGTTTFEPNNVAVREDVAVAIVKAKNLGGTSGNLNVLNQFRDQGQISSGLREHVAIAVEQGFMRGSNIGFEPQKALTRAEACALLSRLIDRNQGGREKITF